MFGIDFDNFLRYYREVSGRVEECKFVVADRLYPYAFGVCHLIEEKFDCEAFAKIDGNNDICFMVLGNADAKEVYDYLIDNKFVCGATNVTMEKIDENPCESLRHDKLKSIYYSKRLRRYEESALSASRTLDKVVLEKQGILFELGNIVTNAMLDVVAIKIRSQHSTDEKCVVYYMLDSLEINESKNFMKAVREKYGIPIYMEKENFKRVVEENVKESAPFDKKVERMFGSKSVGDTVSGEV